MTAPIDSSRPTTAPFNNLLLIGFMGSGKSSVGHLLATQMGLRFVDTDALIVESAGMQISELFAKQGEVAFREHETDVLASLMGQTKLVVATGGGIVTQERNLPLLRQLGFVIGLTASEEVIFERVSRNTKRPLLHTPNPRATIAELFAARAPLYATAADFMVDTSRLTHAQVAKSIIHAVQQRFPESL